MSTYIIAEAGVNHDGSIEKAIELVRIASRTGANAVKFQTFIADEIVTKGTRQADYQIKNAPNTSQHEMLKALELSAQDHRILFEECARENIDFLSSPFDEKSLNLLLDLGVSKIKVGSGEITNYFLLKEIAKTHLPVILSTGMSSISDVERALSLFSSDADVSLLHCTTNYPTTFSDVNLLSMLTLKNTFDKPIGYSDHTEGMEVAVASVALGATIVEKHLTYDRNAIGPDHQASLDGAQFKEMVCAIRRVEESLGSQVKRCLPSEEHNQSRARKSLVFSKDMKKGERITFDCLTAKRPSTGVSPMDVEKIIGFELKEDVVCDTVVTWALLQGRTF